MVKLLCTLIARVSLCSFTSLPILDLNCGMIVAIIRIKLFSTWAEQPHTVYAVAAQVQLQNTVTMTKQEIEIVNEYN